MTTPFGTHAPADAMRGAAKPAVSDAAVEAARETFRRFSNEKIAPGVAIMRHALADALPHLSPPVEHVAHRHPLTGNWIVVEVKTGKIVASVPPVAADAQPAHPVASADMVLAEITTRLDDAKYRPGDSPSVPVRIHDFMQWLEAALSVSPTKVASAPEIALAIEGGGCSHEWISGRAKSECRKCKAVMVDGSAYYPSARILEVVEAALAEAKVASAPVEGEVRKAIQEIRDGTRLGFINEGDAEDRYVADGELACPYCGGSGHKGDVAPAAPQQSGTGDVDELADRIRGLSVEDHDRAERLAIVEDILRLRNQPASEGVEAENAAARDVLAERVRQREVEGWTPEHDDEHTDGSLALVASIYADPAPEMGQASNAPLRGLHPIPKRWPSKWSHGWWKAKDRRRSLVKAGALILAEIERLDRQAQHPGTEEARIDNGTMAEAAAAIRPTRNGEAR